MYLIRHLHRHIRRTIIPKPPPRNPPPPPAPHTVMPRVRATLEHPHSPGVLHGVRNGGLGRPHRQDTRPHTGQLRRAGRDRGLPAYQPRSAR